MSERDKIRLRGVDAKDLAKLQVDADDQLYWNGKRVRTGNFRLSHVGAFVVGFATVVLAGMTYLHQEAIHEGWQRLFNTQAPAARAPSSS